MSTSIKTIVFVATAVWVCSQTQAIPDESRKQTVQTDDRGNTTRYSFQTNPDHGAFEVKETDKNGKVTQWYQHFVDKDGKVLIDITRQVPGFDEKPPYESIQFITYNVYRPDGNIAEYSEYTGDGALRRRVKYVYDDAGNWIEGIIYDAKENKIGKELTPPEARLYGKNRR